MEYKNTSCPSSPGVMEVGIIKKRWKKNENVANITIMNTAIMIKIKTWTVFMIWLTDDEQMAFETALSRTTFPAPPFSGSGTVTTIEELCEQWKGFSNDQRVFLVQDLGEVFVEAGIPPATQSSIITCLLRSVG